VVAEGNREERRRVLLEETTDDLVLYAGKEVELERIPDIEMIASPGREHPIGLTACLILVAGSQCF